MAHTTTITLAQGPVNTLLANIAANTTTICTIAINIVFPKFIPLEIRPLWYSTSSIDRIIRAITRFSL